MWIKLTYVTLVLIGLGLGSSNALSQESTDPGQMALKYAQAQAANGKALMAYTWQQRTELSHEGEEVVVKLVQIHFDAQGKRQVTQISEQVNAKKQRGLRKRIAKKKEGELKSEMQQLVKLATSYLMMTEGQTVDFFQKAKITPDEDSPNVVEISGTSVLNKGDSVQLWMDTTTQVPSKMNVTTTAGEDSVTIEVDYRSLKVGPHYPSQFTLGIPSKEMQIQVEDYDFTAAN